MCGRFASFLPAEALARIFGTMNPLPNLAPSWNVAPTQDAAVVRRHTEQMNAKGVKIGHMGVKSAVAAFDRAAA